MEETWSKLDNAAKIYPATVNARNTTLFRFEVTTKELVEPKILQQAVDEIMPRFPYFQVHLKRGLFWYYFKKVDKKVTIQEDKYYPCTEYSFKKSKYLFSLKYSNKRIALEFSHSITDGAGALEFMKALLLRYYSIEKVEIMEKGEIKIPGETIDPGEYTDAFKHFYDVNIPSSKRPNLKAFHLNYPLVPKGIYHTTTGSLAFSAIKKLAKEKNLNITAMICVLYIDVFQHIIYEQRAKPVPIVINLPINLRNIFGSKTMYNFFVPLTPTIDPRIGFFSEEDIIKHVRNYLNIEIDRRYVGKLIKRNIKLESNMAIRVIPLVLKKLMLPVIYNLWGERGYTSGVSNLGKIEFPPEIEERLSSVNIIPPPSPGNIIKMICFSFKEQFYITFGSLTDNKTVEELFFKKIRTHGIPVKVRTIS
jgi:NRPS condensation-like uncharacterized protein